MRRIWMGWLIWAGCVSCWSAGLEVTRVVRQPDGIVIHWMAEAGQRYEVQSAASVLGPWRSRASVEVAPGLTQWLDIESETASQQYYRLSAFPTIQTGVLKEAFVAADSIPKTAITLGEQSGEIGAGGAFLASQLGAGGLQLVTVGTLTQQGQNWTYAPSPTDRLEVRFATGTNATFYITRMEGDFSVDATTFLRRSHHFEYRAVVPGVGDIAFSSQIGTGTPNLRATALGTLVSSNVTFQVDLTLTGQYRFDVDSTGSSLLNDHTINGTIAAPQYRLAVNHRRRFELVVATLDFGGAPRSESATADQEWINNTLTLGQDTYQWVNASKQKSFKNGKPSSIDSYWKASGGVLKNGQPFGTYELRVDSVFGFLRFYLVLPDDRIELESWNALL